MCKKIKKVQLSFPLKYVGPTLLFTHLKDLKLFKHLLYEKLRAAENPKSLIIRKLLKPRSMSVSCPNFHLKYKTNFEISQDFEDLGNLRVFVSVKTLSRRLLSFSHYRFTPDTRRKSGHTGQKRNSVPALPASWWSHSP